MLSHEILNSSTEWHFDFTKLQKIAKKIDPNNPVVPVVVQDVNTKEVLIVAYANELALKETIKTRVATFWSTSRNELWIKGKTSGDMLKIHEVRVNCDQNSLLYIVEPLQGGACHVKDADGKTMRSCYFRRIILPEEPSDELKQKGFDENFKELVKLEPIEGIKLAKINQKDKI